MRDYQSASDSHTLKNIVLALAMLLFLALSFKLAGNLSVEKQQPTLSQTDSVFSTLNQPPMATIPHAQ